MPGYIAFAKSGKEHAPTLPQDAVTRTFGIFGVKDSGKTTTARVLVEGIARIGGHVVVLDPVGVWWGATRAGEKAGIPGIVLGGEHGDVPLEESGGELVAELAVSRHYPLVVVDLKLLRKGAAQRFMADFLEGIYFQNRRPLHVVFEEADRALPQSPRGMDPTLGRVLGAAEDIVKLGRSRGLGSTFVSQRFATVQKNVTEQIEALFLHRQVGPNDRKAVKAWIESNGDPAVTAKVLDSMASLEQGEAWLYSPGWLRILERVRMRKPVTFDSSATPRNDDEVAAQDAAPRAPVDLDELRDRMAETVERAEANDPKKLQARIRELERLVEETEAAAPEPERILVPDREAMAELAMVNAAVAALFDELREAQEEQLAKEAVLVERIEAHQQRWAEVLAGCASLLEGVTSLPQNGVAVTAVSALKEGSGRGKNVAAMSQRRGTAADGMARVIAKDLASSPLGQSGSTILPKAQRAVLTVLAQWSGGRTKKQAAMLTGYSGKGGGFNNALSALRGQEFITRGDPMQITPEGREALGSWEPLPEGPALLDHWKRQLGKAPAAVLDVAVRAWPDSVTKEQLAEITGYEAGGGGFNNALSRLRTLELIEGRGEIKANDTLALAAQDGAG